MTQMNRRHVTRALIALAGFNAAAPWVRRAEAQTLRKVNFILDVNAYGKHALFYPAIENGYFRDAGLEIAFHPGKGSADVAVKVAAGSADAGFADAATTILARGKGAKLKQVMMVHYKNMNCTLTLASNPIRKPEDLIGKKMGATAGDAPRVALPALARINKFDHTKVSIITMESPAKPAMLMSRQVDGIFSLSAFSPVNAAAARKQGEDVVEMLYADYGLDIYSNGIVVNDDVAAKDPDFVKRLINAFARSCVFAVEKPAEAITMFMKHNPAANPVIARAQLDVAIAHLMVDEVKANGIGPMSQKKMDFTVEIVREFYGLQGAVTTAEVYSNDFAPSGLKPRI